MGTANVTVLNLSVAIPVSNAGQVAIIAPAVPTLASISPAGGPVNTAVTATLTGTNFTTNSTVQVNGVSVPTTFNGSTQIAAAVPANLVLPGGVSFTVTTPAPGGGTSTAITYSTYVAILNNSMAYNPIDQLFCLSIPGKAGAPYANSIVSLDPVTGLLGTPIPVGSEPNCLALTDDGKYLWVSLDGASAVRKVDLVAKTAGLQFSLPGSSSYHAPLSALAMVAIPGQTDSVAVSAYDGQFNSILAIFDAGVMRGNAPADTFGSATLSLQIDGSRNELYGAYARNENTYTYSATGLALKGGLTSPSALVANSMDDRIQIPGGRLYTDYSTIFDMSLGYAIGAFGSNPTNQAGSVAIDGAAGLAFVLDSSQQYASTPNRIELFHLSDFSSASTSSIPVNFPANFLYGPSIFSSGLTRWGVNGLAFRSSGTVFLVRSNLVKDLTATLADVGVSVSASGTNLTGSNSTYVVTVSNAGGSAASEVDLTVSLPVTGVLISATPSSGNLVAGSGVTCNLGSVASGGTATVTMVFSQLTAGSATLSARVSASQLDANQANNQATLTTTISGATYTVAPAVSGIAPAAILAGNADTLITVTGAGFGTGSVIQLDWVTLTSSVLSSTQLTATVPSASIAALGWRSVRVANPAPGGGVSTPQALSVYQAIKLGANRVLYDPFSQRFFATLGSAMPSGNSIETVVPETGMVSTPIYLGSEPTRLAAVQRDCVRGWCHGCEYVADHCRGWVQADEWNGLYRWWRGNRCHKSAGEAALHLSLFWCAVRHGRRIGACVWSDVLPGKSEWRGV